MRKQTLLDQDWRFTDLDGNTQKVNIPHTWNALDGQDGGDNYRRGTCTYEKKFPCPTFDRENQRIYLEFEAVSATATVILNGTQVMTHRGG